MDPLVFTPYARPQIWGERRLERHLGKRLPPGTFGEAWELSAHPHHVSRVAEGAHTGSPLDELWRRHGRDLVGPRGKLPEQFPLLIKYLDCHLQLSVQVHPNDALAARLRPGEQGKTEAWVILSAEPDARIYAGLRPGITPADLRRHLEQGTVDECLHSFVPQPGDCLFLPAGTVHGVGGGVLMAEVQQSSDATFRLFDWNRLGPDGKPRELHVEESLAAIDWNAGPTGPVRSAPLEGLPGQVRGVSIVECPYFKLTRFTTHEPWPMPYAGEMSIWMILAGETKLAGENGYSRQFHKGETVLIPATSGPLTWQPSKVGEPVTLLGVQIPAADA
ncbi:MAG TPA: type I phosphomannose isomerase catalytic subunit [Pirellulales bacterium]|jgi:mannose-6-phosphate isomerase|nr:type I phosphomannose isomerase catalytic subunit [Pirellulales bacterium]